MAALVHRIKDKVRSRSSSQSSTSSPIGQGVGRNSAEVPRVPDRHAVHASSPTSPTTRNDGFPRASLENSAFHVSRGAGGRTSIDSPVTRKPLPTAGGQHQNKSSIGGQQSTLEDIIPPRGSSRHGLGEENIQTHNRGQTAEEQYFTAEENTPQTALSHQTATTPPRVLSGSNQTSADTPTRTHTRRVSIPERLAPRQTADSELSKPLPEIPAVHKSNMAPVRDRGHSATPTNDPVSSSAWMSPLISTGSKPGVASSQSQDRDAAKYEALARGHLRLPENFNLQDTEETHIYETQRPAVTYETIVKQRTEIIQEEITRTIHMHHYYTYQQPIKVLEILPAKHYFLNLETGEKTEIAPPFGWTMPPNMFPVSPDTSQLAGWTRHYLVNDEHPFGVPEEPSAIPLKTTSSELHNETVPRHHV